MVRFSKKEMQRASKYMQNYLKKYSNKPTNVKMEDMDGKKHTVSMGLVDGLFESTNLFRIKHGRLPNWTTLNVKANNPLVWDAQDSIYTCCPTSLSMAIQMLYGFTSENECKKALQTNTEGTTPANLIKGAKTLGYKVQTVSRNYASVVAQLKLQRVVIAHIETKPATCLRYEKNYGHYVLIYKATNNMYYVADPSRGLKNCSSKILDKATNGRDIKYYSVSIL